jgi:hypothetical protein
MPRGYRLFLFGAVAAIASAFVIAWLSQPKEPNFAGHRGYQEQAAAYRAGGSGCEPTKIGTLPIGLRQGKADACAEAEEQHREAANGLIEARRSADAADTQAVMAYQQARIETWGAAVGFLTLLAALSAAIFAERAAFHTKASSEAYKARERAELIPGLKPTPYVISAFAKNVGPTKAILLLANSALFAEPPDPVPFIFEGHGRASVAIEGEAEYDFGQFDWLPKDEFYFIGAIIYETVFGDVRLMKAGFKFNTVKLSWEACTGLDFSLWEKEAENARRSRGQ